MRLSNLAVALVLTFASQAHAAPVTLDLYGNVSSVSGALSGQLAAGNFIHFTFTYDTAASSVPFDTGERYLNSDPFSVSLASSGFNFSWTSPTNDIAVENDIYFGASQFYDQLTLHGQSPTSVTPIQGQSATEMGLSFSDGREACRYPGYPVWNCPFSGIFVAMLSSFDMPTSIDTFQTGRFSLKFADGSQSNVNFTYAAPIPGTIWLFGSSLVALGGIFSNRRKRRNQS